MRWHAKACLLMASARIDAKTWGTSGTCATVRTRREAGILDERVRAVLSILLEAKDRSAA